MACPMCRLGAWLRRNLKVNSRTARAERAAHAERNQLARRNSYNRRDALPPPYPRPPPTSTENLDTLRARNPPSPFTNRAEDAIIPPPPPPTGTLLEACQAAARNVGLGLISAICEDDGEMVAARILRTIATSVSTSHSYPAFVAAVTMAESLALIHAENPSRSSYSTLPDEVFAHRWKNAFDGAIAAAMAAADDAASDARPGSMVSSALKTQSPVKPAKTPFP